MILNGQKLNQDELNSAFVSRNPYATDAAFEAAQPGGFNPLAFNIYPNTTTNTIRFYNNSTSMWEDLGAGGAGGTTVGTGAPTTPGTMDGEYYFDDAEDDFYKWNDSTNSWILLTDNDDLATFGSGAPTVAPASNGPNTYIDTAASPPCAYEWNGSAWILIGAEPPVMTGTTTPTTAPNHNQAPFFYNSTNESLDFYDGSGWVPLYPDVGSGGSNTRGLINSAAQTIAGCKTFTQPVNNNYIMTMPLQGQQVSTDPFKPVAWTGSPIFQATAGGTILSQANWTTMPLPGAACAINGTVTLANRSSFDLNMVHLATKTPTEVNFHFCSGSDFILKPNCYVRGYYSESDRTIYLNEEVIASSDPALITDRTSVTYATDLQADLVNVPSDGKSTFIGTNVGTSATLNDTRVTKIGHNLSVGSSAPDQVVIGADILLSASGSQGGRESVMIGGGLGNSITTQNGVVAVGFDSVPTAFTGNSQIIGNGVGGSSIAIFDSTLIGQNVCENISSVQRGVGIGRNSARNGGTYEDFVAVGYQSAGGTPSSLANGVAIGSNSAQGQTMDGSVILGSNTMSNPQEVDGRFTNILGANSGQYNKGRNNTYIGENLNMAQSAALASAIPITTFETIMRVKNNSALTLADSAYYEDFVATQKAVIQTGRGLSASGNSSSRGLEIMTGDIEGNGTGGSIQFKTSKQNAGNAAGTRIGQTVDVHINSLDGFIGFGGLVNPVNPLEHNNGAFLSAGGVWTDASDETLKENIQDCEVGLVEIKKLKVKKYKYKTEKVDRIGLIAQDVKKIIPEVVSKSSNKLGVQYQGIVVGLVNAVKELSREIDQLKKHHPEKKKKDLPSKSLYLNESVNYMKKNFTKKEHLEFAEKKGFDQVSLRMTEEEMVKKIKRLLVK